MRPCPALAWIVLALGLGACGAGPVRTGPLVDTVAPAPFLTQPGAYPTQNEGQAAIETAATESGYRAIFPRFSMISEEQIPTYFTMFACRPGYYRPAIGEVTNDPGTVTCHVDVMDQGYKLLGRATMSFARNRDRWHLASKRDRDVDAR